MVPVCTRYQHEKLVARILEYKNFQIFYLSTRRAADGKIAQGALCSPFPWLPVLCRPDPRDGFRF